ncbi:hypothetical protein NEDG_00445 [Nematocida displodere]|uniref:Homeobox domain-containing protein n=1 Tax=Nematocida displodere TaxID=1805483 RepID=A0A177EKS4_9MICR|nr:hypothetical protein NEDG_00445 [Nematocida displodere]
MSERKYRARLTPTQNRFLSLVYAHNPRPDSMLRRQIAKDFGLPLRSVQVWFQNMRARDTRAKKAASESREAPCPPPFFNSSVETYEEYFTPRDADPEEPFHPFTFFTP